MSAGARVGARRSVRCAHLATAFESQDGGTVCTCTVMRSGRLRPWGARTHGARLGSHGVSLRSTRRGGVLGRWCGVMAHARRAVHIVCGGRQSAEPEALASRHRTVVWGLSVIVSTRVEAGAQPTAHTRDESRDTLSSTLTRSLIRMLIRSYHIRLYARLRFRQTAWQTALYEGYL